MSPKLPAISVVTPSYNQATFIERTIRSVLGQDYPDVEYIVLDGGSTDGSVDIIARYAPELAYWRSAPDGGQASAVNEGWRRATGEILGWLNSDDFYLPGTLGVVGRYFAEHPDTSMLYGTTEIVDDQGVTVGTMGGPFDLDRVLRGDYMIPQPSVFIRRRIFETVGPLDETLYYSLDLDLFLRIALVRTPDFVPRALSQATVHVDAKMSRGRAAARRERFRVAGRYARGWTRFAVWALALRSRIHHSLPWSVRRRLDRMRGIAARTEG